VQADPTSNPNWLKWVSERFEDVLLVVSWIFFFLKLINYLIKKTQNTILTAQRWDFAPLGGDARSLFHARHSQAHSQDLQGVCCTQEITRTLRREHETTAK
jgi:hypothetical protein